MKSVHRDASSDQRAHGIKVCGSGGIGFYAVIGCLIRTCSYDISAVCFFTVYSKRSEYLPRHLNIGKAVASFYSYSYILS